MCIRSITVTQGVDFGCFWLSKHHQKQSKSTPQVINAASYRQRGCDFIYTHISKACFSYNDQQGLCILLLNYKGFPGHINTLLQLALQGLTLKWRIVRCPLLTIWNDERKLQSRLWMSHSTSPCEILIKWLNEQCRWTWCLPLLMNAFI